MPEMEMARIGDYCDVVKGKVGIKKATVGKYPLVTTAEDRLSHNECHFKKPSVIIPVVSSTGHGHASLRRIHYQEGKFAVGSILCAVTPKDEKVLNANYLYHYLDVYKEKLLVSRMKGMANVTLPLKEIENVGFPLLSIEKQMEWVALFEKTKSYTGRLTSEITHQQTLLKKLRRSILQNAISGKLTEIWRKENPDVEPATETLERIKAEKKRLVKEKKIKKQKPLPPITEDEIPFELPEGWVSCRLDYLINNDGNSLRRGPFGSAITKDMFVPKREGTYKIYEQQNAIKKNCKLGKYFISKNHFKKLECFSVKPNDIIISCAGTIGETYLLPEGIEKGIINQALLKINLNNSFILNDYFLYLFKSITKKKVNEDAKGSALKNMVSINNLRENIAFPIPPMPEQIFIMKKIEELFSLCDSLEQQINKSQRDSELLMQAVLQEAFTT